MNLSRRFLPINALASTCAVALLFVAPVEADASGRKNAHGAQGTGNYKGKRDRHEKPGPGHEKKKKNPNWQPQKT